ncbi:MAG TPA: sulfotransferase [Rhizomicrobium sp.]|nr:sulfotransferase [Rhizomicrobium sp.]
MSNAPANAAPEGSALADPQLQKATEALRENKPQVAEAMLRRFLEQEPQDVQAMTLLAETLIRFDRNDEAAELLARAIEIAPNFVGARHNYANVLLLQNRPQDAFAQIDVLLQLEPSNPAHHGLKAMAHSWIGDHAAAAAEYEILLSYGPKHPGPWMAYAHVLRIMGQSDASAAAYRKAIAQFPRLADAYWALANLKTHRFTDAEIAAMRSLLESGELPVEARVQIQFAVGRGLGDGGEYEASFALFKEGNATKRATLGYNAERTSVYVTNCRALFTQKFFSDRTGWGSKERDPIFVVGMPRSGSTLVEQIMASHPAIEGTMELRVLPYLVARTGATGVNQYRQGYAANMALSTDMQAPYPESLRNLDQENALYLGRQYLEKTRGHRTTDRPFFIDKMPDNFAHIGLIQLILPNAKIIDVRRHPLPCGLSNFEHYFAVGKDFSYSLADLGRYYHDYVQLMSHFDNVLPGKVHRIFYEQMVDTPEAEIRRLLEYLELPFDEHCLRFHENTRAVRTASSEQVRRPIFTEALSNWRHYEEWLGPLKAALGPALDAYPYDGTTGQKKNT